MHYLEPFYICQLKKTPHLSFLLKCISNVHSNTHTGMAKMIRLTILSIDKDVEQLELMYFADRSLNYCNHFGKLFGCIF